MFIIKYKKIFLSISAVLVASSILAVLLLGINISIDFKGGAITEVTYTDVRPDQSLLTKEIENLGLGTALIQPTGERGYIVKTRDLSAEEHITLLGAISLNGEASFEEANFNSIGPSVGAELTKKAIVAVALVALAIIIFIAFAFRKVSETNQSSQANHRVPSWKYGIIAVVTLLHDVIISVGIFALLSHFYGAELDTLFVVAVLTILGLSVSDTIVIFDRIRENLIDTSKRSIAFAEIVGESLEQSFSRSLATSLTLIFALLSLVFFGPKSTQTFAMMLTAGIFFGTYSSIFLASPLLVLAQELQDKKSS